MPKLQIVKNNVNLSQPITYNHLIKLFTDATKINSITSSIKNTLSGFMPSVYIENKYRLGKNITDYTGMFGFDLDLDKKSSGVNKYDLTTQQSTDITNDLNRIIYILDECNICFLICPSVTNCGIRILVNTDIISGNENEYKFYYEIIKSLLENIINQGLIDLSNNKNNSNKYLYQFDNTNDPVRYFYYSHIDKDDIIYTPDNILLKETLIKYDSSNNNIQSKITKQPSIVNTGTTIINIDENKINTNILDKLKTLDKEDKKQLHKWLKDADNLHHGTGGNLFMIKKLNSFGRKYFYEIYKKYYNGGDDISTYENFIELINNCKENETSNQKTLKGFFKGCNIVGLDCEIKYFDEFIIVTGTTKIDKFDFLDTKYDYTFSINRYITEDNNNLKNDLIELIKKKDLMIKSKPNTGKTTFIVNFIKQNSDKNFLFISNKNILGEKIYLNLISQGIEEDKIVKWYGKINKNQTGNIYLSSIPALNKLNNDFFNDINFDYCIIDEAHLLIDFIDIGNKDVLFKYKSEQLTGLYKIINNKAIRKIYISATPEYFSLLKNIYNFNYIDIECPSIKKKIINIIIDKSPKQKCIELLNYHKNRNEIVDVYINDVEKLNTLKTETILTEKDLNDNKIEFLQFSSSEKNNPRIIEIIETELLPSGNTIMKFTSYGQEGLNFNNKEHRNILIVANDNTDFKDIYQFINRFRFGNINITMIMSSLNQFIKVIDNNNQITYEANELIKKPVFDENEIINKYNDMRNVLSTHKESYSFFGNIFTNNGDENYFDVVKKYKIEYLDYLNRTDKKEKLRYINHFFNFRQDFTPKNKDKGETKFTNYIDLDTKHFQDLFLDNINLWKYLNIQNIKTFDLATFKIFTDDITKYNIVLNDFEKYSKEIFYVLKNLNQMNSLEENYNANDYIFKNPKSFNSDIYCLKVKETLIHNQTTIITSSEKKIMKAHNIKDENFIKLFSKEFSDIKEQVIKLKVYDMKKQMNYIDMIDLRNIINLKTHLNPVKEIDFIISITKKLLGGEIKKIMNKKERINRLYFQV